MTNLSGANLNNGAAVGPQGEGRESPSTFPVYPAYKDSGVEWLGEVPEHWTVQPLKRAIAKIESGTSVNAADYPAEPGSYGVLKTSCVYTGQFDWRENKTVDDEDLNRVSCPLKIDTLVVSRMNTPDLVGATGLVTEAPAGIFLPDRLWQVYFEKNQSASFVFYFTKAPEYREQVKNACSGTSSSMQNLGQDDFRTLLFVEPPVAEQTQVARFLDHETARIDALIEEQQRLIELLKEKRQAVISHAVTKGLDPKVPMKDSGLEWLGEVPAHWDVVALKRIVEVKDGTHATPNYVDQGLDAFPLITSKDFIGAEIDFDGCKYISREDHVEIMRRSDTQNGDVLMSMIGGNIGKALIVETSREFSIKNVALFKSAGNGRKAKQIMFFLESRLFEQQTELFSRGGAQGFLGLGDIRSLLIPKPSEGELDEVLRYLAVEVPKLDSLIEVAAEAIQLMNERRSALISAAVTGKIDVRGWQPPASAPTPELAQEAV